MAFVVSSDPHAFLRPIYRQLAADRTFHLLAEQHQYDRLVEAAAQVSERHAAAMREYSPAAKAAILRHLAKAESMGSGQRHVELWRLRKGGRELVCIAALSQFAAFRSLPSDGSISNPSFAHW